MKKNVILAVLTIVTIIIGVVTCNRENRYNWCNHNNEPISTFSRFTDGEFVFEICVDGKCDTWPKNLEHHDSPVTSEMVRSAFEIASKQHAGEDVKSILFRNAIQEEIQKAIDEQYEEGTITVRDVIIFDYDFRYKCYVERMARIARHMETNEYNEFIEAWN